MSAQSFETFGGIDSRACGNSYCGGIENLRPARRVDGGVLPQAGRDDGRVGQSRILQGLFHLLLGRIQGCGNSDGECRFVRGKRDRAADRGGDAVECLRGGDAGKHSEQKEKAFHEGPFTATR